MSTKIYEAWRFPAEKLNEFISIVRPQQIEAVKEFIQRAACAVKAEKVDEFFTKYTNIIRCRETEDFARASVFFWMIDAEEKYSRLFNCDCGWNIWFHDGLAYVIPWGEDHRMKQLDVPGWAEEYGYWNNTDKPDDITDEEWDKRSDTWDAVCLNDWDAKRLTHDIILTGKRTSPNLTWHQVQIELKGWNQIDKYRKTA